MTGEGDCGAVGGMKIGRGNRNTRRKPAPAPLCPPQIPFDHTRVRSCGICGGQSDTGTGFLLVLLFPLPFFIPPTDPHSSSIIRRWCNKEINGRRTKWTHVSLTPPQETKKKKQ
jgi:hypothetical protein